MMKNRNIGKLLALSGEISDLAAAAALLEWDQQVCLPPGAGDGRALQMGTMAGVIHEKATSKALGRVLDALAGEAFEPGSFEFALVRRARRDFDKRTKTPAKLVRAMSSVSGAAYGAWQQARQERTFALLEPHLARLVELKREYAALHRPAGHILDALLDDYEEGLAVAELDRVFGILRPAQVELVREVCSRDQGDDSFLRRRFSPSAQLKLAGQVVRKMGYDFDHGRLDLTEHPFTTEFGLADVRITTKVFPELPLSCLFSTVHEAGHALYGQGIDPRLGRTPLADGASLSFHESQSRLWENQVARSLPFWRWLYPAMRKRFRRELGDVSLERFYRAVNRVRPSLIRTEADEATYNLHIMLRYELEKGLFGGTVEVSELPELWRVKMKEYLGVVPDNDLEGVLQDVHWPTGGFGYFPTYALGNVIAAQVWQLARRAIPALDEEIAAGRFTPFREFLREKLQKYGASLTPKEMLVHLTGSESIDPAPFLDYLRKKFL